MTDPAIHIRPAVPLDAAPMRALVRAVHAKYVPRLGRESAPMTQDYQAAVAAGQAWVATAADAGAADPDAESIVGVLVMMVRPDHLYIDSLAVAAAQQGRGIGAALLAYAEERAGALGLAELRLCTNEAMTENLSYYPRRGFRQIHREVENGFNRVYFTRRVGLR